MSRNKRCTVIVNTSVVQRGNARGQHRVRLKSVALKIEPNANYRSPPLRHENVRFCSSLAGLVHGLRDYPPKGIRNSTANSVCIRTRFTRRCCWILLSEFVEKIPPLCLAKYPRIKVFVTTELFCQTGTWSTNEVSLRVNQRVKIDRITYCSIVG